MPRLVSVMISEEKNFVNAMKAIVSPFHWSNHWYQFYHENLLFLQINVFAFHLSYKNTIFALHYYWYFLPHLSFLLIKENSFIDQHNWKFKSTFHLVLPSVHQNLFPLLLSLTGLDSHHRNFLSFWVED